ncbi:ankyrin repeat protein [Podospora didyma]|uniref:Ankyrin repeat protein n=1 Tax=Podospora didyma TaxID=330526 RepID=A0AAE0U978_9PEZI|nr:ankyrin repeat protein [Podospora didyma]
MPGESPDASPLILAVKAGNIDLIDVLLSMGYSVNETLPIGHLKTPLHVAAALGSIEVTEKLIRAGAKVNIVVDGESALHSACRNGHLEMVMALFRRGALPHFPNKTTTPLHIAATAGHASVSALLLLNEMDPNTLDQEGFTPAHLGARHGDV